MQNLPIPASATPPQVNVAPFPLDTAPANGPDSEAFSAVLARELAAKKSEPDTALSGAAMSDDQPQPPGSEMIPLQIPSEPSLAMLPLLALTPGMQPDQFASVDQPTIPLTTAGPYSVGVSTSDQASGDQPLISVNTPGIGILPSDQASGDQPLISVNTPRMGVSPSNQASGDQPMIPVNIPRIEVSPNNQASGDQLLIPANTPRMGVSPSDQPLMPVKTPKQHTLGVLPSDQASGDQPQIPAKALPAALSTEISAQRNFPQAKLAARPAAESDHTADFAASGKFLPPVAAEEKTFRSGTEAQVLQRLPEAAPLSQMTHFAVAAAPVSAAAPTTQNLSLDIRVGAPGWNGELAQKVVWMATQQQQVAELRLNPPHLGPVEVTLTVGNDPGAQTSIQFASPHLVTRDAIESALPRLREMMADSGIALGNVTVNAELFQQQAEAGRHDRPGPKHPADMAQTASGFAASAGATLIRSGHEGLVDTFA